MNRLALYIHIPFCRRRCAYCDFASTAGQESLIPAYVDALTREIAAQDRATVATIYLGGGTPSLLAPAQVPAILGACRAAFDVDPAAEITLEANPGAVDAAGLSTLRAAGANRLSLGVQSFAAAELALLGRIHTAEQAVAAYAAARAAGFANVSLDLIYGLPGQSVAAWARSLDRAVALRPDHLSLYALEVHEDTPLGRRIAAGDLEAPDDDLAADMYELAEDRLAAAGLAHYELSNWAARDDAVCRHNLTYWRNEPYLGLGAAAHSWLAGERRWNVADPGDYIARVRAGRSPVAGREAIDRAGEMAETMFMGLRLLQEGVSAARFRARFGQDLAAVYGEQLRELAARGLVAVDAGRVRLTRPGRLLGNEVFCRFVVG